MALPVTFANLPTGNNPAYLLDAEFAAVAQMGTTYCTATGTNNIALTVQPNQPNPTGYAPGQRFNFIASATNTGPVTIAVGPLAPIPLHAGGVAVVASAIIAGTITEVVVSSSGTAFDLVGGGGVYAAGGGGGGGGSVPAGAQYQMLRYGATGTIQAENAPYDLCFSTNDGTTYAGSQVIVRHAPVHPLLLPTSLTGSRAGCVVAPTGSVTITLAKNGTSVGSVNFAASATTGTFTFASATQFGVSDLLTIVAPASPDATLAGLYASLLGIRQ